MCFKNVVHYSWGCIHKGVGTNTVSMGFNIPKLCTRCFVDFMLRLF